jgi:hypothetical protein
MGARRPHLLMPPTSDSPPVRPSITTNASPSLHVTQPRAERPKKSATDTRKWVPVAPISFSCPQHQIPRPSVRPSPPMLRPASTSPNREPNPPKNQLRTRENGCPSPPSPSHAPNIEFPSHPSLHHHQRFAQPQRHPTAGRTPKKISYGQEKMGARRPHLLLMPPTSNSPPIRPSITTNASPSLNVTQPRAERPKKISYGHAKMGARRLMPQTSNSRPIRPSITSNASSTLDVTQP